MQPYGRSIPAEPLSAPVDDGTETGPSTELMKKPMSNTMSTEGAHQTMDASGRDESAIAILHAARAQLHRRVWMAGLWPAFRDSRTGETHLARTADGQRAVQHSFEHIPDHWVVERDAQGHAVCLHPAIQAGYWRSPDFFAFNAGLSLPLDS